MVLDREHDTHLERESDALCELGSDEAVYQKTAICSCDTAANHYKCHLELMRRGWYGACSQNSIPEPRSANMANSSIIMYIQKNATISVRPTAVYLQRVWYIVMAVMRMATM